MGTLFCCSADVFGATAALESEDTASEFVKGAETAESVLGNSDVMLTELDETDACCGTNDAGGTSGGLAVVVTVLDDVEARTGGAAGRGACAGGLVVAKLLTWTCWLFGTALIAELSVVALLNLICLPFPLWIHLKAISTLLVFSKYGLPRV